jgi:hypothetical protein
MRCVWGAGERRDVEMVLCLEVVRDKHGGCKAEHRNLPEKRKLGECGNHFAYIFARKVARARLTNPKPTKPGAICPCTQEKAKTGKKKKRIGGKGVGRLGIGGCLYIYIIHRQEDLRMNMYLYNNRYKMQM